MIVVVSVEFVIILAHRNDTTDALCDFSFGVQSVFQRFGAALPYCFGWNLSRTNYYFSIRITIAFVKKPCLAHEQTYIDFDQVGNIVDQLATHQQIFNQFVGMFTFFAGCFEEEVRESWPIDCVLCKMGAHCQVCQ